MFSKPIIVLALASIAMGTIYSSAPVAGEESVNSEESRKEVGGFANRIVQAMDGDISLTYAPDDADFAPVLVTYAANGRAAIKSFFGDEFPSAFAIQLFPSREDFNKFFREQWSIPETECWWVAAGDAKDFVMLSPRTWTAEACEHDANDSVHVKGIVIHELVHVFHGQHNPKLEELNEIGWFVEGLAVYASGQLEQRHLGAAREAISKGAAPERLSQAWSGQYRYGVSGSLVRYIDRKFGRDVVKQMLASTSQSQILEMIHLTEDELLAAWKKNVMTRI